MCPGQWSQKGARSGALSFISNENREDELQTLIRCVQLDTNLLKVKKGYAFVVEVVVAARGSEATSWVTQVWVSVSVLSSSFRVLRCFREIALHMCPYFEVRYCFLAKG